jgi:3-isopropylmalate/(R)-2-methylmalate dehydratase small subunit
MMEPVKIVAGRSYPLGRDNVDTDIILPGRYLKTITRTGLASAAFEPIRAEAGNIFSDPDRAGAPIVIAGDNFGCGSSREHAVWAMMDFGIKVVIAEGFSDIFAGNAFKNGLLAVALRGDQVKALLQAPAGTEIVVDLPDQTVTAGELGPFRFEVDPFRKHCLLEGLDEIGLTLAIEDKITGFEEREAKVRPWLAVPQ